MQASTNLMGSRLSYDERQRTAVPRWTWNDHMESLVRFRAVGKVGWPTASHIESLATTAGR